MPFCSIINYRFYFQFSINIKKEIIYNSRNFICIEYFLDKANTDDSEDEESEIGLPKHENNKPELPTRVRLRADLLKNYDKMVHPVVNLTDNVIVSIK